MMRNKSGRSLGQPELCGSRRKSAAFLLIEKYVDKINDTT